MVLVAPGEILRALTERVGHDGGEVLPFTELDALPALDAIVTRKPSVVAIERSFAATPRGAALINRIEADPQLEHTEIRLVAHDATFTRHTRRLADAAAGAQPAAAVATAPPAIDYRGTRRAARIRLAGQPTAMIDGNQVHLVDLSPIGAQIVSTPVLKPNQRVRFSLADDGGVIRVNAMIAWAAFEIAPKTGPRYRVGVEFLNVDAPASQALEGYCVRHKAS